MIEGVHLEHPSERELEPAGRQHEQEGKRRLQHRPGQQPQLLATVGKKLETDLRSAGWKK